MRITYDIPAALEAIAQLPRPLGFVPTMGALHAGHMRLVESARQECASVVASLFVNPLQFGAGEDLDTYPRDIAGDTKKFESAGVDVLFMPDAEAMYPPGFSTTIDVGEIGTKFEGIARPEHFRGVATVVTKLLHIVQPDILYLGQKDAQQTAVLRKLIADLAIPTEIHIVPTVRERDGLAMSSRNAYLGVSERVAAPNLYKALESLRTAMSNGESKIAAQTKATEEFMNRCNKICHEDPPNCHPERSEAESRDRENVCILDYVDAVDATTFEPIDTLRAPAFIIGSARFGTTRLIDNLWIAA